MTIQWHFTLLLMLVLSLSGNTTQGENLETVLKALEQNETLYQNLEAHWSEAYQLSQNDKTHQFPGILLRETCTGWSVRQDGKHFLLYQGTSSTPQTPEIIVHNNILYDGKTTRLLEHKGSYIGNISDQFTSHPKFFDPHILPLRHGYKKVPLSVWLRGREAVLAHPFRNPKDFQNSHVLETIYVGEEMVDGLVCDHLISFSKSQNQDGTFRTRGRREFWLAQERNSLPIKSATYNYFYSETLPIEQCLLEDLREIAPGKWMPFYMKLVVANEVLLRKQKQYEEISRREIHLDTVSLHPKHPEVFFQKIEFPPGSLLYELIDGKIISGKVQ